MRRLGAQADSTRSGQEAGEFGPVKRMPQLRPCLPGNVLVRLSADSAHLVRKAPPWTNRSRQSAAPVSRHSHKQIGRPKHDEQRDDEYVKRDSRRAARATQITSAIENPAGMREPFPECRLAQCKHVLRWKHGVMQTLISHAKAIAKHGGVHGSGGERNTNAASSSRKTEHPKCSAPATSLRAALKLEPFGCTPRNSVAA